MALGLNSGGPTLTELEAIIFITPSPPVLIYTGNQLGLVRISPPIRGRATAARGELILGEELGLHRSNRLPWKRIFMESCRRVSQMELTSSWQSDSAVRAHVWKASQWLGKKKKKIKSDQGSVCHFTQEFLLSTAFRRALAVVD